MFDFASPSRREGDLTDINEKGMVSYDRRVRKDAYYFYRANWNTSPTLHLVGRRYEDRNYAVIDIKAYSNAGKAELSLNGAKSQAISCTRAFACGMPCILRLASIHWSRAPIWAGAR